MKVHLGVDKDSGLIHSVVTTSANVHDLIPTAELLHGDEEVVYGDSGYQGIAKRPETAGRAAQFRVAMRPGKRRALPDTPEGKLLDLIETAKAHQEAVRLSEDQVAWHGQKPLQGQRDRSSDQSVLGQATAPYGDVNGGLVCSEGRDRPLNQGNRGDKER